MMRGTVGGCLTLVLAMLLAMTAIAAEPSEQRDPPSDESCLECHEIDTARTRSERGEKVDAPHVDVTCVDCHADLETFDPESGEDHDSPLAPSACADCHDDAAEEWQESVHAHELPKSPVAAACGDCHGSHDIREAKDRRSKVYPLNIPNTCESCHAPNPPAEHPAPAGKKVSEYETSVHGQALRKDGLIVSATCVSCHGFHDVREADDPDAPTSRRNLPATCGTCHAGILATYLEGVHGAAFEEGSEDVPVCNDCHREHAVKDPALADSSVSTALVAGTCARCHADDKLANLYGFSASRSLSWGRSYHGIANTYGEKAAANCASCHGFHAIFPSKDPRSSVNEANLDKTCGHCHVGASAAFARIPVHSLVDRDNNFVAWLVRQAYTLLVVGLIGAFLLFVLIDLLGRFRIRMGWGPPETEHVDQSRWSDEDLLVSPSETFVRMGYTARLQHGVLMLSFLLLVATGLPVFLHDSSWMHALLDIEGGFRLRSKLHRIAAIVLIGLSLWHLLILAMLPRARAWFGRMLITRRDVVDFTKDLLFSLGIAKRRPAMGDYGLVEKLEYGAVLWGNLVMIATGTILWRPDWFLDWAPSWTFEVCRIIHGFEATLAFLAIIIWHMYHVHLRPDVFPMSWAWLTGRISRQEMRHHHPQEYLRVLEKRRQEHERSLENGDS
jgi:cytochrome b subunit of formate dehydrogenase/nitrate/TMAO reductase-like tetraheme cytochrome c subunit